MKEFSADDKIVLSPRKLIETKYQNCMIGKEHRENLARIRIKSYIY